MYVCNPSSSISFQKIFPLLIIQHIITYTKYHEYKDKSEDKKLIDDGYRITIPKKKIKVKKKTVRMSMIY